MMSTRCLFLGLCGWFNTVCAQTLQLQFQQQGKPLTDVAVSVTALQSVAQPTRNSAIVDQVQKQFTPYVSVIQTGSKVSFPNKDNIRHHVYSFSPAKPFELKLYSGTPSQPVQFDKAGTIVLGCNIHDWMLAYVWVVDTPFFAVSDEQGVAAVTDLPAANYRVQIWHPDQLAAVADFDIDLNQQTLFRREIEMTVKPRVKQGPNNDNFR